MGVLEARYKAEKVGYPIIGEEVKEASDVIDYNINKEITKDTSAIFNANNETTTGMATVIPGVNAPKLIAQTSIYGIDFNAGYIGGVDKYRMRSVGVINVPAGESDSAYIDQEYDKTGQRGPYNFTCAVGKGLILPSQGTYKLECTFYCAGGWSSGFEAKYQVIFRGEVLGTTGTSDDTEYLTVTVSGKKGEGVQFLAWLYNSGSGLAEVVPMVSMKITKL